MIIEYLGWVMIVFGLGWYVKSHLIDFNDGLLDFEPIITMLAGTIITILGVLLR
jgi:hypothetical protein